MFVNENENEVLTFLFPIFFPLGNLNSLLECKTNEKKESSSIEHLFLARILAKSDARSNFTVLNTKHSTDGSP